MVDVRSNRGKVQGSINIVYWYWKARSDWKSLTTMELIDDRSWNSQQVDLPMMMSHSHKFNKTNASTQDSDIGKLE